MKIMRCTVTMDVSLDEVPTICLKRKDFITKDYIP